MQKFDDFWEDIKREFPNAKILYKDESILMAIIDIVLKILTLWSFRTFKVRYITTIGNTMYVPRQWEQRSNFSKIVVARHERVHMRQSKKYGRIKFSLMYLFCLPTVFTYRAIFEREAYEESIRAYGELGGEKALNTINRNSYINNFVGPNYLFMWPFKKSVASWFDKTIEKVRKDIREK